MPTTYNGIGTHYYGKRNVQKRPGACRSCGRTVQLESYDTRLWFVVFFIPVIPLGRKHIIDACPACRRHYVSDLQKWETARRLEVSEAMDKYRSNPTPENAIAAHQHMLSFHQVPEATEFEKTMLAQFADNAKVYAYLGSAQEHLGRLDQAIASYKRALDLRSDLPEARVGMARGYIREGRLDDARRMLGFLEKTGSAQLYSLEPLDILAAAYQSASRHQEAVDLFTRLIEELPKIAEHPGFRKRVKQSEKALGRYQSILPKQKFSFKRLFEVRGAGGRPIATARALLVLGMVAAAVILGFAISNEYIRHHRKLYLVNGYKVPATVQISGVGEIRNLVGVREFPIPEGHFHAVITGPVRQELDFDVRDTYLNRWFGDPLWLINVGGGALLAVTEATYSQNPQPPTISFNTGRTFEQFTTVTHPFTRLPESIQVESGETRTLVQLDLFKGDADDVFTYYERKRNAGEAFSFAETWLGTHPDDGILLMTYTRAAEHEKQNSRADSFLRSGLTNRPVRIEWHRAYQTLHDHRSQHAALVTEYDCLLRAEPTNSALLYLRGRLETDRSVARDYFKRAADADPRNAFAEYALAYDRIAAGDWDSAKPLIARAAELKPDESGFARFYFLARLATGEAPALEQEARHTLNLPGHALDYLTVMQLVDSLVTQGKQDEAVQTCNKFINLVRANDGSSADPELNGFQYHTLYAVGDFDHLKSAAQSDSTRTGRTALTVALLEQGHPDEAAKILPGDLDEEDNELFSFAFAVLYRQNGNADAAATWRSRGIEALLHSNADAAHAAAVLQRGMPPTRAEAESFILYPQVKAMVLAMLLQEYPQARADLADLALKSNAELGFPSHLVHRLASAGQR